MSHSPLLSNHYSTHIFLKKTISYLDACTVGIQKTAGVCSKVLFTGTLFTALVNAIRNFMGAAAVSSTIRDSCCKTWNFKEGVVVTQNVYRSKGSTAWLPRQYGAFPCIPSTIPKWQCETVHVPRQNSECLIQSYFSFFEQLETLLAINDPIIIHQQEVDPPLIPSSSLKAALSFWNLYIFMVVTWYKAAYAESLWMEREKGMTRCSFTYK